MPPEILVGAAVSQPVEEMHAISHDAEEDHPSTGGCPVLFSHQTPDETTAHEFHQQSASEGQDTAGMDSRTDATEELVEGDHRQVKVISLKELQTQCVSESRR